jgi:taurine transport system substrate-binding protein
MPTRRTTRALTALVATLLAATACAGGSGSGKSSENNPTIGIGYFQGATTGPESLIAANPELAGQVRGTVKLTPINSGVAGLAELRAGAFPFVSGVGNPPVVGAIATGTRFKVIYAEYYDAAQLIVPKSFTSNDQLVGKTIGVLTGSSEDFELRGWLKTQGLDKKVTVSGFPSEAAAGSAWKAHKIDAAYVELAQALDLQQHGGKKVVDAQEIAKLGYASVNVLGVTDDFAKKHPDVVQQVVCQAVKAQAVTKTPEADRYITNAAKLVGAPPALATVATKLIPFVAANEELAFFKGPSGNVSDGGLAKAFALTGDFLKEQGRVPTVPSADQIDSHIDSSYVEKALADKCGG